MFEWLETTAPAIWVGESLWGYPIMLGCHVVGLAIVVGLFMMRDLRLLGFFQGISYQSLDSLRNLWLECLLEGESKPGSVEEGATTDRGSPLQSASTRSRVARRC